MIHSLLNFQINLETISTIISVSFKRSAIHTHIMPKYEHRFFYVISCLLRLNIDYVVAKLFTWQGLHGLETSYFSEKIILKRQMENDWQSQELLVNGINGGDLTICTQLSEYNIYFLSSLPFLPLHPFSFQIYRQEQ